MKKTLKIIGITLGSIFGLIVLTAAIAVWGVFTPARLTPVVRQVADQYITSEWDMGDVELTFFSTFPEFGLKVNGFQIINPMSGAPSDTLLVTPNVVAIVNVKEYLEHNNLIVRELKLEDLRTNIYINEKGQSNLNVFVTDTSSNDTTTFHLPFDSIVVDACSLSAERLTLVDKKDSINVALNETKIALEMDCWNDIHLEAGIQVEQVAIKGEEYARDITLSMDLPIELNLETMYIRLREAKLQVNDLALDIDGELTLGDSIPMDISILAKQWSVASIISLVPEKYTSSLKDINIDGLLSLDATAKGMYANSVMPLIDAQVVLKQGEGAYKDIPYTFTNIDLDGRLHLDLNTEKNTCVTLNQLTCSTKHSTLGLHGTVRDLLGQMQTKAHLDITAPLTDWMYFLPNSLRTQGKVKGDLDIEAALAQVMKNQLNSIQANGQLHFSDFQFLMDSITAQVAQAQVAVDADLKDWPVVNANLTLQSNELLSLVADSLDAQITAPQLTAHASLDTKDTTHIPTFDATLAWEKLQGYVKTCQGVIGSGQLKAKMTNSRRNQSVPVFSAYFASQQIDAKAGESHITTQSLNLDAKAMYRKNGENFLLKWNPILSFWLNGAEADLEGFDYHVSVPQIIFKYSNREFDIISSNVILGRSDFSLTGQIHRIGKWLQKQENLSGELNFVSNYTDVDEFMDIFSAKTGSEETPTTTTTTTDSTTEPFLVPLDVDLTLNTHIKRAHAFDQYFTNLGGKVYVKDGTLVLEEMGFACDAAKLQLTGMYRTPRRNHIYLGLDYHMIDVKIDQLISMIPQIDTMMPMLRSFKGEAEFHLAGETYLSEDYSVKTSTLRGACSLFGKDLVILDGETFDKISKILSFKKKTENKVDSISAEITLNKDEITIYPFCVSIDNYMAALGGKHNLDMSFNYHINLLSPVYLGVDVSGNMDNLSIKPAKCVYAKEFKPVFRHQVDTRNAELRQIIRESLRKNVKIQ